MPPARILNAHPADEGPLLRQGYQYDPDAYTGFAGAANLPEGMPRQTFYEPTTNGYERFISERLRHWA